MHATAVGIGERVGNTQMDLMLVNLKLMGIEPWASQDLTNMKAYCESRRAGQRSADPEELSRRWRRRLPHRHRRSRRRLIKAFKKNDIELANTVYSGVPSHFFGLEQIIDIGPMSGKSNVHLLARASRHRPARKNSWTASSTKPSRAIRHSPKRKSWPARSKAEACRDSIQRSH